MKLRSTIGALAMVFALFGAADASAQERVVVNVDNVKVGQAPAFDAPGAPVARGAVLTVLERNGDWIRVFDGTNVGFIHTAFVAGGAPAAAPPAAAAPPQAFPSQAAAPVYPGQYAAAPTPGAVRAPGSPGYKDPTTAQIFSAVIIGGGQFYSGDTSKGIMLAGIGYGSLLVAPAIIAGMVVNDAEDCWDDWSGDYSDCYDTAESAPALIYGAWAVGMGTWIYGIMSADDSAKRTNATPYYAVTPVIDQKGDRTYAGLQFRF